MRFSKVTVSIAAVLASAGALLGTQAGPAAAITGVTATGTLTCTPGWTGTMTFAPALKTGGTTTRVGVDLNLTFSGCSGGSVVPSPSGGSYHAKGIVAGAGANNCTNWFASPTASPPYQGISFSSGANLDGSVTYTGSTTAVNPSNVSFPSMRIRTGAGGWLHIRLANPPAIGHVNSGSYAPNSSLILRVMPKYPAVISQCAGAGVSHLKIVPSTGGTNSTGYW